jgi:hypothetical protein
MVQSTDAIIHVYGPKSRKYFIFFGHCVDAGIAVFTLGRTNPTGPISLSLQCECEFWKVLSSPIVREVVAGPLIVCLWCVSHHHQNPLVWVE